MCLHNMYNVIPTAQALTDAEEGGKGAAPYTLKCANHLGDVRLQNCPSPEEQKVLYFTAQWERDGGGVYDVAKFTQPEVTPNPQHCWLCSVSCRGLCDTSHGLALVQISAATHLRCSHMLTSVFVQSPSVNRYYQTGSIASHNS